MQGEQAVAEQLLLVHEMTHEGAGEPGARRAAAAFLERPRVAREAGVAQVEPPPSRERRACAGRPRRKDAVEHVDPACDHLEDPLGVAEAHEVARLLGREHRCGPGDGVEHRLAALPHRQPPEREAVEGQGDDPVDRLSPQVGVRPALRDPEPQLPLGADGVDLALRPELRPAHGRLVVPPRRVGRRADVEAHRDVGAEPALDLGHALGRQARGAAVVDRAEGHALVVDAREGVPQREDLEAAGVRQDRPAPAGERVQAAELLDHALARSEVQVVRVPEDHVRAERRDLRREERLHRALRADRHERGRADLAVGRPDRPGPGGAVGRLEREAAHGAAP